MSEARIKAPEGHIINDQGVVVRVLGDLPEMGDGTIMGDGDFMVYRLYLEDQNYGWPKCKAGHIEQLSRREWANEHEDTRASVDDLFPTREAAQSAWDKIIAAESAAKKGE